MLTAALTAPAGTPGEIADSTSAKVQTTQEEVDAFTTVAKVLGDDMTVEFEDSASYFKIHVAGKRTWVVARLQLGRRQPVVWVPLAVEECVPLVRERTTSSVSGWTLVTLDSATDLADLGGLLRAAYTSVVRARKGVPDGD